MTELEKYREHKAGPTQDTYFYGLRDPRSEVNLRFAASRHPGRIGLVAAFDTRKTRLLKALYKRLESFARQLQICSASPANQWLRNLLDSGNPPEVRLLFYAPAFPIHDIKYTCERLGDGAVYDARVLQPVTQEVKEAQLPEAQAYVNQFFAKWFQFREAHPESREWLMPGVDGYAQVRSVAPAHRLTVKSLQEQIEKLAARIELLESRPTV